MRRQLRRDLPGLAARFGLRWEHVADMPFGELNEYLRALQPREP